MIEICALPFFACTPCNNHSIFVRKPYIIHFHLGEDVMQDIYLPFCGRGFFLFSRYKPFIFKGHYLSKLFFILWGQLGVLLQERDKHVMPQTQGFHFLSVVIFALPFPLWDKRASGGEGIFIKISEMDG